MPEIRDRFHAVDLVEPPDVFSDALRREPSQPPVGEPTRTRKAAVIAVSLIVAVVAIGFAWSAFNTASAPSTVGSTDSAALVATLAAPDDGSIPGLTLAYSGETHAFFAQGGQWRGVNSFILPLQVFADPLSPGTSLKIQSDASQVEGKIEVLDHNYQLAGKTLPLDLSGGSVMLPNDPGSYKLDLTGTWPQGTAEFFVVIHVSRPTQSPSGIPANLPPASSLKTCAGLPVTIVASNGQKVLGTPGNDVVGMDPTASYSPNGGTDIICDGSGTVQSISYPDGSTVPGTSNEVAKAIRALGGSINVGDSTPGSVSAGTVGGEPADQIDVSYLPAGFKRVDDTVETLDNGAQLHSQKYSDGHSSFDVYALRRPEPLDLGSDLGFPTDVTKISIGGHDAFLLTASDGSTEVAVVEWQSGPTIVKVIGNHLSVSELERISDGVSVTPTSP